MLKSPYPVKAVIKLKKLKVLIKPGTLRFNTGRLFEESAADRLTSPAEECDRARTGVELG
jgi:hypothetical protein